ncbi:hypothetical protein [Ralstonia phage RP13]|nr:hypothetical protein [Ralstonia phage RP13]
MKKIAIAAVLMAVTAVASASAVMKGDVLTNATLPGNIQCGTDVCNFTVQGKSEEYVFDFPARGKMADKIFKVCRTEAQCTIVGNYNLRTHVIEAVQEVRF